MILERIKYNEIRVFYASSFEQAQSKFTKWKILKYNWKDSLQNFLERIIGI